MRASSRNQRQFRPSTDVLESLAPVSSLVPGISAGVTAKVADGQAETRSDSAELSGAANNSAMPSVNRSSPPVVGARASAIEYITALQSTPDVLGGGASSAGKSSTTSANVDHNLVQPLASSTLTMPDVSYSSINSSPGASQGNAQTNGGAPSTYAPPISLGMPQSLAGGSYVSSNQTPVTNSAPSQLNGNVQALGASAEQRGAIRPLTLSPSSPRISYVERQSVAAADSASGSGSGSGGPTLAQEYGAPTLGISGDMIGGSGSVSVSAPGGMDIIQSVQWSIGGAEQGQSYSVPQGSTTDLQNPISSGNLYGVQFAQYGSFYWNYSPNGHGVSAVVTYVDGSQATATGSITLDVPTVNNFTVSQTAAVTGQGDNGQPGMSSVLSYSATVTIPEGVGTGQVALIQFVNRNDTLTNTLTAGGLQSHNLNSGGFVLDNNDMTEAGIFEMPSDTRTDVYAGATSPPLFGAAGDQPGLYAGSGSDESGTYKIAMSAQFIDYLVYQPGGGIWVEIAQTPAFTVGGTMTWNNDNNVWDQTNMTPASTNPGVDTLGFVSWESYEKENPNIVWTPAFKPQQ